MKVLPPLFFYRVPEGTRFRTCRCCEQGRVSADTPKGFPLARGARSAPLGKGFAIPSPTFPGITAGVALRVLECRPLLPSVARPTIQSILRGSLSPPQQQSACEEKQETGKRAVHPHNNNARAKEKRGNGKENISFFPTQQLCVYEKNGERKTGVHDSPGRIFVHRLNTSRRARQGSLDGWMGLSVALPKVAADDYPVLRERPLPCSPPCKKAIPKDAGASGKPLPIPAGMAPCSAHPQVRNPVPRAPTGRSFH